MSTSRPAGIFVTGTDTGVGKTRVACWIVQCLASQGVRVGVCKPAATGARCVAGHWVWDDIEQLRASCPLDVPEHWIGPYRWRAPLAPPAAAKLEPVVYRPPGTSGEPNIETFVQALDVWSNKCDVLVVEGVGGLLAPLTSTHSVADLAAEWGRPVVVVASDRIGTINHTLLTLEVAESRGLDIKGIIANTTDVEPPLVAGASNVEELKQRVRIPVWGPVEYQLGCDPSPAAIRAIDWARIATPVDSLDAPNRSRE